MKSATGFSGSGSRDWLFQRISAVVLVVYIVVLLGWYVCHHQVVSYEAWYSFMMSLPMKLLSLVSILALAAHAWIGLWTVFTDYITTRQMGALATPLRMVLQTLMMISVIVFTLWGIQIFW